MTGERSGATHKAQELREAFDDEFSRVPERVSQDVQKFLAIRVGGDFYAIALSEITGIFVDRKVVPLPGNVAELLGIAGLRGDIVPVYSLAAFLGYGAGAEAPRWLMRAGRDLVAAFAFDKFEGYAQIPKSQISAIQDNAQGGHIRATAFLMGSPRPIISIDSIVKKISGRIAAAGTV